MLALAAEQLREPALDADEVRKAVVQAVAGTRRARESTAAQAAGALTRRLYGRAHPKLRPRAGRRGRPVRGPSRRTPSGRTTPPTSARDGLTLALVGDVPVEAVEHAVRQSFEGWAAHGRAAVYAEAAEPEPPGRVVVAMEDRQNLDVRLGHAVALRRDSADFLAAYAGVFALGGNFSGRLMQTVRDEQGLTYGVGSSLGPSSVEHDGHVAVSVTLSQENLGRGVEARPRRGRAVRSGGRPGGRARRDADDAGGPARRVAGDDGRGSRPGSSSTPSGGSGSITSTGTPTSSARSRPRTSARPSGATSARRTSTRPWPGRPRTAREVPPGPERRAPGPGGTTTLPHPPLPPTWTAPTS